MFVVGVIVFLCQATPGYGASYSGAWYQSDRDNWFAIELSFGSSGDTFGMYDWGDPATSLEVVLDGMYERQSVWVWEDTSSGTWYAGLSAGGTDLTLGDSALFGFYFSDGSAFYTEYGITGQGSSWILEGLTGFTVSVSDVRPVPLPANAMLLGSGLLGLLGVSRRRRKTLL